MGNLRLCWRKAHGGDGDQDRPAGAAPSCPQSSARPTGVCQGQSAGQTVNSLEGQLAASRSKGHCSGKANPS